MKHLLFILSFLFCLNSYSQGKNWTTHNGKPLSQLPAYIQVVKEWGNNPTPATVYYGGEEIFKRINRVPIMLNGKEYRFNDIMEVVNVFHYYGYEIVSEINTIDSYAEIIMYNKNKRGI